MASLTKKISDSAKCTALFLLCLIVCYAGYIRYASIDVVFYGSLVATLFAALISFLSVLSFPSLRSSLSQFELLQLLGLWVAMAYIFSISLPTVVDRSLSIYLLEKLDQRGGGIEQEAFGKLFKEEYLLEHRLVDVRLTEQLISGTIQIEDECVSLTQRGEMIVAFTTFFRRHLLPAKRLLLDEYTDDLVFPFRSSPEQVDYICQPKTPRGGDTE